jgi:hypothetical protein
MEISSSTNMLDCLVGSREQIVAPKPKMDAGFSSLLYGTNTPRPRFQPFVAYMLLSRQVLS